MQSEKENIERFFDDSWGHMHQLLDEHFPVKEKKKKRLAFWWTGLAAVFITAGCAWWYIGRRTFDKTQSHVNAPAGKGRKNALLRTNQKERKGHTSPNIPIAKVNKNLKRTNVEKTNDILDNSNRKNVQNLSQKLASSNLEVSRPMDMPMRPLRENRQNLNGIKVVDVELNDTNRIQKLDNWNPKTSSAIAKIVKNEAETAILKQLPRLPAPHLFAKATPLRVAILKRKKRRYADLYSGVSMSNLGYSSGFIGGDVGYSLTNRLNVELGLGYRTILIHKVLLDSMGQAIDFDGASTVEYLSPAGLGSGSTEKILIRNKGDLRIDMVEMPIRMMYRVSPKWSAYVEAIGVYQFAKVIPPAELLSVNYGSSKVLVPVANLSSHIYMGMGGGVVFGQHHWRWMAGYNNWAYFRADSHFYAGLKYRF